MKSNPNCQQIYNNFYNIFNPEIQNNIQINELNKKSEESALATISPDKSEYTMDIKDYKKLLIEKNEYIKLLLSENTKLKEKVSNYLGLVKAFHYRV